MRKIIFTPCFILLTFLTQAQDFQGKAEYFSKKIANKKTEKLSNNDKNQFDAESEKSFQDAITKAWEKKYLLTFNKFECVYEEQKELEKPRPQSSENTTTVSISEGGKKYLNIKQKQSIKEQDIYNKEFLIVETIKKPDWKLVNETKKIGTYNCFKAELLVEVTENQKKEYEELLKKEEIKPSLFKVKKPEDKIVIAWYTPEIPVAFGPKDYWGLPGLILEIDDEKIIILCYKVALSNKEKTNIRVPNSGKKVTQKEFDEIQRKKDESMQDEIFFSTED